MMVDPAMYGRVYPRVGGGNRALCSRTDGCNGLSPRGRGKPRIGRSKRIKAWSIPAWAGETRRPAQDIAAGQVYPRVGGGNQRHHPQQVGRRGLSPRGRGKQTAHIAQRLYVGSIPAWAGETPNMNRTLTTSEVYPRVGGGNHRYTRPRRELSGLSPRGRGKPATLFPAPYPDRSIPAWAGETRRRSISRRLRGVYPRVGGGNMSRGVALVRGEGLSPRGRGKPAASQRRIAADRSIPAWAGETNQSGRSSPSHTVYPRVGGGNLPPNQTNKSAGGLSPRGRGKLRRLSAAAYEPRSIPAWAGETERGGLQKSAQQVYPRVGGGNEPERYGRPCCHGLSPRGRGKRSSAIG